VLHGLQGPVKVLGRDYGVAAMTAFKDALSDEDIAAVLTFVRQNPEWGHSASAVKPEQVAAVRQAESSRALPPTAAELEKVPVE
jgi:mono/diheme cytochrome c family protein